MPASTLRYAFSTALDEPPTGSQVRFDAADPYTAVSRLWVRLMTTDGIDAFYVLMTMPVESAWYVQDKNDHTRVARFRQTGAPVDKITYIEVPVAYVTASGVAFANTQEVVIAVVTPAPAEPPTPDDDGVLAFPRVEMRTPLITLVDAKDHLKVRDDYHDAEIGRFVLGAQNAILDYLKRGADPAWTEATLPLHVRAAVLYLLTHHWKHRGDDMSPTESGGTPDADVWDSIDRILARSRDPALA